MRDVTRTAAGTRQFVKRQEQNRRLICRFVSRREPGAISGAGVTGRVFGTGLAGRASRYRPYRSMIESSTFGG